ncbi:MAG: hypothetical protein HY392_03600, partial [Candidatus Diapherotrites archaeon]|nr:hypothetical protein [Candidatus Diapherotrites archaeon]
MQSSTNSAKDIAQNATIFLGTLIILVVLVEIFFTITQTTSQPQIHPADQYLYSNSSCSFGNPSEINSNQAQDKARQLFEEGKKAFAEANIELAAVKYTESINKNPNVAEVYDERAKIYYIIGEYNKALLDTEFALELCQKDYKAYNMKGALKVIEVQDVNTITNNVEKTQEGLRVIAENFNTAALIKPNLSLFPICVYKYDPHTNFSMDVNLFKPHLLSEKLYPVKTNSIGIRESREITKAKDPKKVRVLFMGDSYVFGYGVLNSSSIPFILEQKLNHIGKTSEIINLGVPGFDFLQENLYFERFAGYSADIVLIGANETDIFETKRIGKECIGITANGCLFNYKECLMEESNQKYFLEDQVGWLKTYKFLKTFFE